MLVIDGVKLILRCKSEQVWKFKGGNTVWLE